MSLISMLQQFSETNTVILLIALLVMFVVAFKLLEMIFQTILVSALSAGFYVALAYYIDTVAFSLNSLLFFAFIGGTLYTGYSLLTKSYQLASTSAYVPIKIMKGLFGALKDIYKRLSEIRKNEESKNISDDEGSDFED